MKQSILCVAALALGLGLSAGTSAAVPTTSGVARAACCVDDPPPEPVECPMCGGNATVHARRMLLIQERVNGLALLATRW